MSTFTLIIYLINFGCIITMIFIERRKPEKVASWTLVMAVIPILGFLIYALTGAGLSWQTKRMIKETTITDNIYNKKLFQQKKKLFQTNSTLLDDNTKKFKDIILFNTNNSNSILTKNNEVEYFTSSFDAFESMKNAMKNAKKSINLQTYIFADDIIGNEIKDILIEKASQGVKIRILYDSVGSLHLSKKFFNKLISLGAEVVEFFPPFLGIKIINLKANYRNHRKILVIDGEIGFVGGLNIRDDHLSRHKRLSPWRDTHLKVHGYSVYSLQRIFFSDFMYAGKKELDDFNLSSEIDYPIIKSEGNVSCQIISCGPNREVNDIKELYLKLISNAKKSIFIQTPYLIIDESIHESIRIAVNSGVSVSIMLPKIADKSFVYNATMSFAQDLAEMGVNIYLYDGFLHAKSFLVDNEIVSIGTCNFDIRSFSLNFETTMVIYNKELSENYYKSIVKDLDRCNRIMPEYFENSSLSKKFKRNFCRLFSPLM